MRAFTLETMRRIVVVGTSGSGKTRLASALARRLGVPHIELDALHWGPRWTEAPLDVFRDRVDRATGGGAWVVDGNYTTRSRDLVWPRADTIVWLDYPLPLMLWRIVTRTLGRLVTREALWSANRESLRTALSRDSIILWVLRTYRRHRRDYAAIRGRPQYAHLRIVRLRSPREARRWLAEIEGPPASGG